MQLLNDLVGFAQTNQIFSGVAAAGGFASAIYWAREIPNRLARLVTWSISTEIEISNDSEAYQPFLEWMEAGGRAWHTRNFKISNRRSRAVPETGIAADQSEWTIAPGAGTHLIWLNGWPYRATREISESPEKGDIFRVREVIRVKTPGFRKTRLIALVAHVRQSVALDQKISVLLFRWGGWNPVRNFEPRPLDTIVLKGHIKDRLLSDLERFRHSQEWYRQRGLPWRRGYLFAGPPGTGKSSLAMALAGMFDMPVYALNLGSIKGDDSLIEAVMRVEFPGLLLIEDIDTVGIAEARGEDQPKDEPISLGALLNVLDGAIAQEGRVVIMTTNHPERIDPALMRPGRIDVRFDFDDSGTEEISEIFRLFFGCSLPLPADATMSPAEVQGICLEYADDHEKAAMAIIEKLRQVRRTA